MKFSAVVLTLCFSKIAWRQLPKLSIENANSVTTVNTFADTLNGLPFWDDFSTSQNGIDSLKWVNSQNVFINNSLPVNPPTQYVATFDGINSSGSPYNENASFSGLGDELISAPIDLSSTEINQNTVFLSFFWQLQGNGELPERRDSLSLQFLDVDTIWTSQNINLESNQNALNGGVENLSRSFNGDPRFQQVIIPVNEDKYFHEGFQFKFSSYSNLSGVYDTWHIDYVYLNSGRSPTDTEHFDRSFSGQPTTLFYPYVEMPAHQFRANPSKYLTSLGASTSNLAGIFFPTEVQHTITNLITNQSISSGFILQYEQDPMDLGREFLGISTDGIDLAQDSITLRSTFIHKSGDKRLFEELDTSGDTLFLDVDLKVNDTLTTDYLLHNYFAYDDGSAEFASGVNQIGAELAVQFFVEEQDTLTDIAINFPRINPSSVGQALELRVWGSLESYLRGQPFVVESSVRDEFQTITLSTPLIVTDTFYIGFKQFTNDFVGVGIDRNNLGGADKIYSRTSDEWVQNNRLQGSFLMRPIFRDSKDFVLASEKIELNIYPNPIENQFRIEGSYDAITVMDLGGKEVYSSKQNSIHDISKLSPGLYLIKILSKNTVQHQKIIKR